MNKELEELEQAYKRLFQTDDGKRVLGDLEKSCGQNHTSVDEQSPNALKIAFQEGKRRVFLRIQRMIKGTQ